ncbi:MAG TPA: hypothetical protein VI636_11005 [Candidatus Angelobacter sp.]
MSYFRDRLFQYLIVVSFVFAGCLCASGQTLHGTVTNGTTKKADGGEDVLLLRPDKGMAEEARTKTNARGEFTFQLADTQFMRAVRVRHQNVNYHQAVFPGSTSVGVTVYESAPTVAGIHRLDQSMVLQAQGGQVQVYEVFNVQNDSQPPRTQPDFSFYLPEGAKLESGEAVRAGAMPLKSAPTPVNGEPNKYLFMYPLIPGQTHFEVVYTIPYSGTLKIEPKFAGAVEKFYVLTPKSLRFSPVSASLYQPDPQQAEAFGLRDVDAHVSTSTSQPSQLAFEIAGEGVLQQQQEQPGQQGGGGGQTAEDNRPGIGLGVPNERPNPLSSGQWGFLGILTLFMVGGAAFLFITANPSRAPIAAAQPKSHSTSLLDALKEEMFQLEADRIHGKVSTEEYNSAKAALDKTLQRAMKRGSQ